MQGEMDAPNSVVELLPAVQAGVVVLTWRMGGTCRVRTSTSREGNLKGSNSSKLRPITMATAATPVWVSNTGTHSRL